MMRRPQAIEPANRLLLLLMALLGAKLLLSRVLTLTLPDSLPQEALLLLSLSQEILLIGLPAIMLVVRGNGISPRMGQSRGGLSLALCAVALGLAFRAFAAPLTGMWCSLLSLEQQTTAVPDNPMLWCLQLLTLAIVPAFAEECLFRGAVLSALLSHGTRITAGILTTLLFTLLHGNLAALPAHLLLGAALTILMLRSGRLYAPILMHFAYNAASLFSPGMSALWLALCALAVLALAVWALLTMPKITDIRMKRSTWLLSIAALALMALQYIP